MPQYASLKNYPVIDQTSTKTLDHSVNRNRMFQCVECSVLSTILFFHPELIGKLDADMLQDMVLGSNQQGGSDALDFVSLAAKYGVKLTSLNNLNPAQQIFTAHKMIQQGFPVIVTLIDGYVDTGLPQYANWTHVNTFHAEAPNGLIAMDSLGDGTHIIGGQNIARTDAEWMQRLRGSVLWIAENKAVSGTTQPTQVQHPAIKIPQGWRDDGATLIAPNGFRAQHGFREYILMHNWNPANTLQSDEYQDTNGNMRQDCFSCALQYNPKDGVTLIEGDAFLHLLWDEVNHYSTLVTHDRAVATSLQQQVVDEQGKTKNAQNLLSVAQESINTLTSSGIALKNQVDTLDAQHDQDTKTILDLKQSLSTADNVKASLSAVDSYIQQALKTFDEVSPVPVATHQEQQQATEAGEAPQVQEQGV